MSTVPETLGTSVALGFWTTHAPAMDALHKLYCSGDGDVEPVEGVDRDIAALWGGERQGDIVAVIEHAEADSRRFLKAARSLAMAELGRVGSPLAMTIRGTRDPWTAVALMTPTPPHRHDEPFEISLSIESSPESEVTLYVSVWRKGGKRMGSAMAGILRDAYHGVAQWEAWYTGSAVIGAIPLRDCLARGSDLLDFDTLAGRLSHVLGRQDNGVLERLVALGREPGRAGAEDRAAQ
jgi:hypothetical protein